jgi:hypothetical protein
VTVYLCVNVLCRCGVTVRLCVCVSVFCVFYVSGDCVSVRRFLSDVKRFKCGVNFSDATKTHKQTNKRNKTKQNHTDIFHNYKTHVITSNHYCG